MISISIAMGIDYSMFLLVRGQSMHGWLRVLCCALFCVCDALHASMTCVAAGQTRFNEEVQRQRTAAAAAARSSAPGAFAAPADATVGSAGAVLRFDAASLEGIMATVLATAGHTVLVSGATLSLCFFSLAFFSSDMLRSVGISSGITVALVLVVTLSTTPAILFTFPGFFTAPPTALDRAAARAWAALHALPSALKAAVCPRVDISWRAYTEFIMRPRVAGGVVLVLTGCAIPLALRSTGFAYTEGLLEYAAARAWSVTILPRKHILHLYWCYRYLL